MMYPRLYLARNLLRDDGVIFISIDDNETANLKLLCDDIFGESNFQGDVITIANPGGRDYKQIAITHEHLLIYSKSDNTTLNEIAKDVSFAMTDDKGGFDLRELRNRNPKFHRGNRPNLYYAFYADPNSITQDGYCSVSLTRDSKHCIAIFPVNSEGRDSCWRWGSEKTTAAIQSGDPFHSEVVARQKRDGGWNIYEKNRRTTSKAKSLWDETEMRTENGTRLLRGLLGSALFDHPKPLTLIQRCLEIGTDTDSLILDFFAGSGTTAQAVMELNLEDGGNRQCICVQMPEVLDADTEAYQAGYRTIADITRARIAKVIDKLKTEQPEKTADLACAHFTLAPSNFKVWCGDVADADALREQLALFQQAELGDGSCDYAQDDGQESSHSARSRGIQAQIAMLAELLLKHGLGALGVHAISKPILLAGITIHRVLMADDRYLWLCFEPYAEALKDEIARAKPAQVILLNSCFVGDKADELLSNLQLELQGLDIGLLVI
jgi:adenine-specific DNA-methyltransferase